MSKKRNNVLLGVRIEPWQNFKIRKFASAHGLPINIVVCSAIDALINSETVPPKRMESWLQEFRESKRGKYAVV